LTGDEQSAPSSCHIPEQLSVDPSYDFVEPAMPTGEHSARVITAVVVLNENGVDIIRIANRMVKQVRRHIHR